MTLSFGRPQRTHYPRCIGCDGRATRAIRREDATQGQLEGAVPGGYDWLCADCEYRRVHPDARPAIAPPRERTAPLQRERLFDA